MEWTLVWSCLLAGTTVLLAGAIRYRGIVHRADAIALVVDFAPAIVAAPLAVFAMEHFLAASDIAAGVPAWLPFHTAIAYLVGLALLAIGICFALRVATKLAASVLVGLFLSFVVLIHIPHLVDHWRERLYWNIALRDLLFCSGVLVFASSLWAIKKHQRAVFQDAGRACASVALISFGVQQIAFPTFAPGVPLPKLTPSWVPVPFAWAYLTGAILIIAGASLPFERWSERAAAAAGALFCVLTIGLYVPILVLEFGSPQTVEGINYVADTLLAAGAVLMCGTPTTFRRSADHLALGSSRLQERSTAS